MRLSVGDINAGLPLREYEQYPKVRRQATLTQPWPFSFPTRPLRPFLGCSRRSCSAAPWGQRSVLPVQGCGGAGWEFQQENRWVWKFET